MLKKTRPEKAEKKEAAAAAAAANPYQVHNVAILSYRCYCSYYQDDC